MSLAHPRAGDSRIMLAVSVPQGGAELLSNIRHIEEYDRRKPSSSQRQMADEQGIYVARVKIISLARE